MKGVQPDPVSIGRTWLLTQGDEPRSIIRLAIQRAIDSGGFMLRPLRICARELSPRW